MENFTFEKVNKPHGILVPVLQKFIHPEIREKLQKDFYCDQAVCFSVGTTSLYFPTMLNNETFIKVT